MSLVSIDKELQDTLRILGITLTEEMYKTYLETGKINFDRLAYLNGTTEATLNSMIASTELGLSGSGLTLVASDIVDDYYLYTNFKAGTLAERLREASINAQKVMESTLKTHVKAKTNWKKLSNAFQDGKVSVGDLPKHLTELNKTALQVIGNPNATKAEQRKLKRLLEQSKKSVEKLAQNGAPTQQLRAAYRKVLRAVKNGDLQGLKNQMEYAIEKKALYNNQRIARTELSRANSMAFARELEENPHIEMVKILLSDRHVIPDECDFIANANLYGKGKGVYPVDKYPQRPYHPQCLCSEVMVATKRNGARFSEERAEEYFSKLPKHKRKALLQGGLIKDWEKNLKGYEGELQKPPKPLPKRLVKVKEA